jgi:hypothetical protein
MIDNNYRTRFAESDFDPRIIDATRKLTKVIWKNRSKQEKLETIVAWLMVVSNVLDIEIPSIEWETNELLAMFTGGGCYNSDTRHIRIYKLSLTTLLHEYRHHMQNVMNIHNESIEEREEDARAWSCSLFYIASPEKFENAMRKGILHFC